MCCLTGLTTENTVKHRDGGVGSVVTNHRGGGESSVVVTTLVKINAWLWPRLRRHNLAAKPRPKFLPRGRGMKVEAEALV